VTRDELIGLVQQIMAAAGDSEEEADRLIAVFEENVPHPAASDLIFYPDQYFGREPSAEEVVDRALDYKPIEL
jgi:hypothetical protein